MNCQISAPRSSRHGPWARRSEPSGLRKAALPPGRLPAGADEASGPGGHFRGLSLRLYNPDTHTWSLNFASSSDGTLTTPAVGKFKNGRGEFFNRETFNGRPILVRFVISDVTPTSIRFEQAFSDDDGKTWETNWVATDTRVGEAQR